MASEAVSACIYRSLATGYMCLLLRLQMQDCAGLGRDSVFVSVISLTND
jgi:hypothetical protein